ncbi:MAG: NAD-dependent deacetylase [Pyrinomonadaceae bacterium]|jgi:NAD-dependent deacetylase|nr:NAD-dependent deacetylase [Pyrinomonadaceae bacterium]
MPTQIEPALLTELRGRLRTARRVFVLTGAGVSAESGVPTFRGGGQSGVWKGMPFDAISSYRMLQSDLPALWEWFDYRRNLLRDLRPNPAHLTLAAWQEKFAHLCLATQNVDGLHTAAGSRDVHELHGNIWTARCTQCDARESLREETNVTGAAMGATDAATGARERPPVCRSCGNAMRPDVVLFGEMLPAGVFEQAAEGAAACDLCFVVGTSSLVYPAMRLPEIALEAGAYTVEINPEATPFSALCHAAIQGRAGEVLPQLDY